MSYQANEYLHYWGEDPLEQDFLHNLEVVLSKRGLSLQLDENGILIVSKTESNEV